MRNPRLYDQIRLHLPDDFLHRKDILGELDDGATQPSEIVRVPESGRHTDPIKSCRPYFLNICHFGSVGLHSSLKDNGRFITIQAFQTCHHFCKND
jgi:hypothetical protein